MLRQRLLCCRACGTTAPMDALSPSWLRDRCACGKYGGIVDHEGTLWVDGPEAGVEEVGILLVPGDLALGEYHELQRALRWGRPWRGAPLPFRAVGEEGTRWARRRELSI